MIESFTNCNNNAIVSYSLTNLCTFILLKFPASQNAHAYRHTSTCSHFPFIYMHTSAHTHVPTHICAHTTNAYKPYIQFLLDTFLHLLYMYYAFVGLPQPTEEHLVA